MSNFEDFHIREIRDIAEMRDAEVLQKQVWGCDDIEVFPALAMIPMCEVGAILLGAFDGERLIGFVFGFPGLEQSETIIHSDLLAVHPEYRRKGIGYKLKLAQREKALAVGIKKITWTFDPLQAMNARLNFGRLGVISDRYLVNYYGETTSFLHRTGSDRLWVSWLLESERVMELIPNESGVCSCHIFESVESLVQMDSYLNPQLLSPSDKAQTVTIEIPSNINSIVDQDLELAVRWRAITRKAFQVAMQAGFIVSAFLDDQASGMYLLTKS